jgi:hypothetical protein
MLFCRNRRISSPKSPTVQISLVPLHEEPWLVVPPADGSPTKSAPLVSVAPRAVSSMVALRVGKNQQRPRYYSLTSNRKHSARDNNNGTAECNNCPLHAQPKT